MPRPLEAHGLGLDLHHKHGVHALEQDGVDVQEPARHFVGYLDVVELLPCQNSRIAADQRLCAGYAALRYSLIGPTTTRRCSIRAVTSTALRGWWERGFLLQALVRTVAVVVPGVFG